MRTSIPAAAALLLAACGSNQAANNSAVGDSGGPEQVTAVNDTTAIDAATGEAANMAADVDYTFNEEALNADRTGPPAKRAATNRSATASANVSANVSGKTSADASANKAEPAAPTD